MKDMIRIASGQGFWGDLLTAPIDQVNNGPIDYMMMDYLAEVTMSIMQKQKLKDPKLGYAKDLIATIDAILPQLVEKNIKLITNGGGGEPRGMPRRDHGGGAQAWPAYQGRHRHRR